jgi:hypothetical protein
MLHASTDKSPALPLAFSPSRKRGPKPRDEEDEPSPPEETIRQPVPPVKPVRERGIIKPPMGGASLDRPAFIPTESEQEDSD